MYMSEYTKRSSRNNTDHHTVMLHSEDPAMITDQMLIAVVSRRKCLQTHPAEDDAANLAVHLLTASCFLQDITAPRTRLSVAGVFPHPVTNPSTCFQAAAEHFACHSLVLFLVTRRARARLAFRAKEHIGLFFACNEVHHWAVRSGAETSLVATGQDVGRERGGDEISDFEVTLTRQVDEVSTSQGAATRFLTADDRQAVVLDGAGHLQNEPETSTEPRNKHY